MSVAPEKATNHQATAFRTFMWSPSLLLTKAHSTLPACRPRVSRMTVTLKS